MFARLKQALRTKVPYHPRRTPHLTEPPTPEGLTNAFGGSADLQRREVRVGGGRGFRVTVLSLDGLTNGRWISEEILRPLSTHPRLRRCRRRAALLAQLQNGGVHSAVCRIRTTADEVAGDLVAGACAVFVEGAGTVATFEAKAFPTRGVSEPTGENVLKGAKDGLVESLRVNTALVRRHIKTPDLRCRETVTGRQTRTTLSLLYLEGLTNPALVRELARRVDAIDVDGVLMACDVEEYIADNRYTLFPQVLSTERADRLCRGLLAGQVGLLVDGLPFAYLLPVTFAQLMKAPDDYAHNYLAASLITVFRHIAFALTLTLPGLYLAVVTFHVEILPPQLAAAIIATKRLIPFSSLIEVVTMLVIFELLIEAGLRLPKAVGQTVSIVGGLVIGEAAVAAGIASPDVIIVIALTGICGFVMPNYDFSLATRCFRFLFVLGGRAAGLPGLSIVSLFLIHHMAGLSSFGVPYLTSFALGCHRDAIVRALRPPLWLIKERARALNPRNRRNRR
ncbi:MAG: spore germination protein [Oscillospiraceae bacterium]|jgi:spore germination protein KA|nr:spore germination protein [Oscillospiraceae bacterium]